MTEIGLRLIEIEKYLGYLTAYDNFSQTEFCSQPAIFGGATRFIQLCAKYALEIDPPLAQRLSLLVKFYLEKDLTTLKVSDIYNMKQEIAPLMREFAMEIKKHG